MKITSVNPYMEQQLATYNPHVEAEIEQFITKGHRQFLDWKKLSLTQRAQLMHRCSVLLQEQKHQLGLLITREMGKVIHESIAEIEKCAQVCAFYAEKAAEMLADTDLKTPKGKAHIHHSPLGLILAVMPWNFPFWQVFRFAAPALMAGNTVLLKHASNVPQCALAIERIFLEAGFPEGCFRTLLVSAQQVDTILSHADVAAATLTGSEDAGRAIAATAGRHLKKTVLELGGSDPFIVLDDAPLEEAVQMGVKSRMINCGQSCIAAKRFIIQDGIFEAFTTLFIQILDDLRKGDPENDSTHYATLAKPELAKKLFQQVQDSLKQGASLLHGKMPDQIDSAYHPPLILSDLIPGMPAFHEELFGPVAAFYRVKSHEEAILKANQSTFGLGSSVWTNNAKVAKEVSNQLESGAVYINQMMFSDPHVPFGGIKNSGYGRELSHLGIKEFVNQKTVWRA